MEELLFCMTKISDAGGFGGAARRNPKVGCGTEGKPGSLLGRAFIPISA